MLILAYSFESRSSYKEEHDNDQDDELAWAARAIWGPSVRTAIEGYQYGPGLLRNVHDTNSTWYWVATTPEAELWLSLNAPPGYEIWDSIPNT